jgi:hypothetical protein
MSVGMVDTLGPYGGDMEGELDGTAGVFGVLEFDLTGGEPLAIEWEAAFGPGGTLVGEIEGTETIPTDIIELELDYQVSFSLNKVEVLPAE